MLGQEPSRLRIVCVDGAEPRVETYDPSWDLWDPVLAESEQLVEFFEFCLSAFTPPQD